MERHRRAVLHLVIQREALGFLVHGDDVGLLLHQRLDDVVGVVIAILSPVMMMFQTSVMESSLS